MTILEIPGGNYVVAGVTGPGRAEQAVYRAYLFKIDGAGNQLWSQVFEEGGNVFITSAAQTNDGGFVLTGMIEPVWRRDILLLKTDALGHKEWSRTLDVLNNDGGSDVIADSDGFTVTGFVGSHEDIHFQMDMYLARFDFLGQKVWSMLIGTDTDSEEGRSLAKTSDGGYVVVGRTLIRSPFAEKLSVVKLVPPVPPVMFLRGDTNSDSSMNISDPVFNLNYQFALGPTPTCLKTADVNDDGLLNLADPIYQLNYLFVGGPTPPPPLSECGIDPTADDLGCASYGPCHQ